MVIQRYLFREVGQSFGAVLTVLLLVYVSNRFVRFLAEAAAGELDGGAIFELLALKLAASLGILVPLALYVAVLLGLGRLHRDSEIVAMTAGGYGLVQLARSVLWLALGFGAISAALSMYLTPVLAEAAEAITREARSSTEVSGILPGRFKEFGNGDQVFYVEGISEDRRSMSNVFVHVRTPERLDVVFSQRARHQVEARTGERFMVLEDGHRYRGRPGDPDYAVTRFARYGVRLESNAVTSAYRKPETIPTAELIGSDLVSHVAELQWRISRPISTVLLAMLAVPLARTAPGQGRVLKLFTGVLVYFVYNNLLSVARKSIEGGDGWGGLGVWPVHVGLALLVLVLIAQHELYRLPAVQGALRWVVLRVKHGLGLTRRPVTGVR